MAWYRVRLRITPVNPPSPEQLAALGRAGVGARRRGDHLLVNMTVDGGDPAGGVIRALNAVLDVVPGEISKGDFEVTGEPERRYRRRRHMR